MNSEKHIEISLLQIPKVKMALMGISQRNNFQESAAITKDFEH